MPSDPSLEGFFELTRSRRQQQAFYVDNDLIARRKREVAKAKEELHESLLDHSMTLDSAENLLNGRSVFALYSTRVGLWRTFSSYTHYALEIFSQPWVTEAFVKEQSERYPGTREEMLEEFRGWTRSYRPRFVFGAEISGLLLMPWLPPEILKDFLELELRVGVIFHARWVTADWAIQYMNAYMNGPHSSCDAYTVDEFISGLKSPNQFPFMRCESSYELVQTIYKFVTCLAVDERRSRIADQEFVSGVGEEKEDECDSGARLRL